MNALDECACWNEVSHSRREYGYEFPLAAKEFGGRGFFGGQTFARVVMIYAVEEVVFFIIDCLMATRAEMFFPQSRG